MATLPGRLGTLTARDLMTERLVVLHETDTIEQAAHLFRDLQISGAPVVDANGTPVGLLSTADIVPAVAARLARPPSVSIGAPGSAAPSREAEWAEIWQVLTGGPRQHEAGAAEPVAKWMSRRLVSVREETRLVDLARLMCRGHWHRVTVVDGAGHLRGIVSTMDVLSALVASADEASR